MKRIPSKNTPDFSHLPLRFFFLITFLYFYRLGDHIQFYQEKLSLFVFSSDFLKENLSQPGGLVIWIGKLLSAFFFYPIAGALIIAGIITLIASLFSKIAGFLSGNNFKVVALLTGVVVFYLQTDYHFLIYNNIGLLFSLISFYLSIRYLRFLKGWIPVIIFPLLYYITGGFSWITLVLLTQFYLFNETKGGWIKIAVLWLYAFLTFSLFREYLFFQTGKTLLLFPFTEINTGSQTIIFISVAGFISLLPLISKIRVNLPARIRISENVKVIVITSLFSIILILIGVIRYDKKDYQYFHVEKLFYQNRYDEVIAYNTANPPSNYLTIFLNNIALCERNELNDKLFSFSQSPDGKTLFLKWDMVAEVLKRGGYFYYTIGMINEAYRWAFENMVMQSHTPEGLKMLIKTELISGNYTVASKYISVLKKTLFYRNDAKKFEKMLFSDTAVNADKELREKRLSLIKTDFFSITDNPYVNVEIILAADSLNRNAFEYKMADMLLKKNYQGIVSALPQFEMLGYTKLPVHIEEALVAYSALNNKNILLPGNIQINRNTWLRWNQFISVFQQYRSDPKAAEPEIRKQFGYTFWYYVIYR